MPCAFTPPPSPTSPAIISTITAPWRPMGRPRRASSAGPAARALAGSRAASGRMEMFGGSGKSPLAIVDYAHTPDALANALRAARRHCRATLRLVFGCGGDRDAGKRPLMGKIAAELADEII